MLSFLIRCAMDTADGCAGSLGVTLGSLMAWVKNRSCVIKECINRLSVPLFECGGTLLPDPQATRLMSLCGRQLKHLSTLLKEILKRCTSWILIEELQEMKKWCDVLGILALHTEVVQWFCHVGLLPELADEDFAAAELQASTVGAPRIPYPANTLAEIYEGRRKELESLVGVVQVSDVLFIDGAVREFGERLTSGTWKRSDLSGCYPPPTLQALLFTYLLDGLPLEDKHCLVIYLFIDLAALLANERSCGHFMRPDESFLGLGRNPYISVPNTNVVLDWARVLLPTEATVMLSDPQGPMGRRPVNKGSTSTPGSDDGWDSRRGTRSSSGSSTASASPSSLGTPPPDSSGAKKFLRYTCRTCCEKLPTLNSLTTHLKSHSRPPLTQHAIPSSSRSDCKPSQVITSKYGRRRSVVSARDAMNPMASRQRRGRSGGGDVADQVLGGSSDGGTV